MKIIIIIKKIKISMVLFFRSLLTRASQIGGSPSVAPLQLVVLLVAACSLASIL